MRRILSMEPDHSSDRRTAAKNLTGNIRLLMTGLLFLCALYIIAAQFDILGWKYRIPVEIAVAAVSAAAGLLLTPIVALLLRGCDYRRYLLFSTVSLLVLLVITWNLRFNKDWQTFQFLTWSFTIPGVGTNFLALHLLARKSKKDSGRAVSGR